jgi:hypothetical protein
LLLLPLVMSASCICITTSMSPTAMFALAPRVLLMSTCSAVAPAATDALVPG